MRSHASINKQIANADNLHSVVKTMKSLAAVTISQFDEAAMALSDYASTVNLGLTAYFTGARARSVRRRDRLGTRLQHLAIVCGTDLGMVGRFNESLAEEVARLTAYKKKARPVQCFVVGERMAHAISLHDLIPEKVYRAPDTRSNLKRLITEILDDLRVSERRSPASEVVIYHNSQEDGLGYSATSHHLLPLDEAWLDDLACRPWASNTVPDIIYDDPEILTFLIREFLFVSLFRTCAQSVVAENGARLSYMEQAQRKIEDMIEELKFELRQTRQTKIDNELFDVIAGYEALREEEELGERGI